MSDKEIRLVIFDIGRVILDFDHMITCRKLAEHSSKDEKYIYDYSKGTVLFAYLHIYKSRSTTKRSLPEKN